MGYGGPSMHHFNTTQKNVLLQCVGKTIPYLGLMCHTYQYNVGLGGL